MSKYNDEDYEDGYEKLPSGERVKTRQYSDGRTTYNFGGPAGSVTYNKYGEECESPLKRGPDSSPFSS